MDRLFGLDVVLTDNLWEFPYRRFVEWEFKDEAFARKFGFGRAVPLPEDEYIIKAPRIFIGQVLFEKLKQRERAAPEYVTEWRCGRLTTVWHPGRKSNA